MQGFGTQFTSSDIKDVNWVTNPHNNLLSKFRQFKRSKRG